VGSYAGATIMAGLLKRRVPVFVRRVVTLVPAVALLAAGIDPTWALVVSQVFLSFGIPFALIPLLRLTNDPAVMGEQANRRPARWAMSLIVVLVIALNLALVWLTITG
jgi:manganese transport protein